MFELILIGLILYWICKPSKKQKIKDLTEKLEKACEENKELRRIILNKEFSDKQIELLDKIEIHCK